MAFNWENKNRLDSNPSIVQCWVVGFSARAFRSCSRKYHWLLFTCVQPSISSHLFVCCGVNPLGNMAIPFSSLCAFFSAWNFFLFTSVPSDTLFHGCFPFGGCICTCWWKKRATQSSDSLQPFPIFLKYIGYDQPSSAEYRFIFWLWACLHQLNPFCKAEEAVVGLGCSGRDAVSSWQRWNCCCSQVGKEKILICTRIGIKQNKEESLKCLMWNQATYGKSEEKKTDDTGNTEWGCIKNWGNSTS